jgi:DNA-binding beta-propeller fold protein YncE
MDVGTKNETLLYVTNSDGLVSVYRYWQHTLVGVLTPFRMPLGECVDAAGDVYIADYSEKALLEYAHGSAKPLRRILDTGFHPYGCAVDPATGNLAVANYEDTTYSGYGDDTGNVAIYLGAKGNPVYYASNDGRVSSLGYDDRGNLLIADGEYEYYGYFDQTRFYYLPKKSSQLLSIDLPNTQFYSGWPFVDSINYDGKYWVVVTDDRLYRYTINIKAQEIDELQLSGGTGSVAEIYLYRQTPKAPATQVVGGGSRNSDPFVGYWKYPAGGDPYYEITADLDGPFGVAISLKQ